jgi:hypothetical protein
MRGFAAGAWGWRRCQGHVGAIYWDTVQSADPLVSPSALLSPLDPRVQGHLDVLEDCGLVRSRKVGRVRTYHLVPAPLKRANGWLDRQRAHWERRLDQLDAHLLALKESTK